MHWKLRFSPRLLPRSLSWSYTLVFSVRHCFQPSFTGAQNCTLRRSRRSTCLAACWPPLNCLWATLGSTLPWLATIPPLPCSTRHLPVLTPCLDRCFTFTSQILQRNLRMLFLVSFKTAGRRFFDHRPAFFDHRPAFFWPPTGVFLTTDRRFFDHRPAFFQPATDRLPTGYRPATDRLPTGYRPATAGYRPATAGYRPATDRLPTGYRRLPTGYRRLPTGCRPATDRLPPAAGYRPAAAGRRLQKKKKKKKKKKKNSFCRLRNATRALYKQSSRFGDWEMPIVPKIFGTRATKWGLYVCLYIYKH